MKNSWRKLNDIQRCKLKFSLFGYQPNDVKSKQIQELNQQVMKWMDILNKLQTVLQKFSKVTNFHEIKYFLLQERVKQESDW